MCRAYDVAKYILYIAYRNGDVITNLKMQKLLYYAQAWYMVNNKSELLFEDEIQAWRFGPVVPAVYEKMKRFKFNPISMRLSEKDFDLLNKKTERLHRGLLQLFPAFLCYRACFYDTQ